MSSSKYNGLIKGQKHHSRIISQNSLDDDCVTQWQPSQCGPVQFQRFGSHLVHLRRGMGRFKILNPSRSAVSCTVSLGSPNSLKSSHSHWEHPWRHPQRAWCVGSSNNRHNFKLEGFFVWRVAYWSYCSILFPRAFWGCETLTNKNEMSIDWTKWMVKIKTLLVRR